MKERVQLLDIAVDVFATKDASDLTKRYMEEEGSRVVYFVNSGTLLLLQSNPDWKTAVEASELILPATTSVNASIDKVLGHRRDSFFMESYINSILDYAIEMGYELLLLTEDEGTFTSIQENIHEKRPVLTLSGLYLTEKEESLEHIVNEINSVAPDILLVALQEKKQLALLQEYRNLMNAGIILFTGDTLYNKAVTEAEVPESIRKLKLNNLYKWFQTDGRVKTFWANLAMKFQLRLHKKEEKSEKTDKTGM